MGRATLTRGTGNVGVTAQIRAVQYEYLPWWRRILRRLTKGENDG